MAGLSGPFFDSKTKRLIEEFGVSNFIIFARNTVLGPEALSRLCAEIKSTCLEQGLEPLIAVDQEGGPVRRLKPPLFPDTYCPSDIVSSPDPPMAMEKMAIETAGLLKGVGIDMNLAPVMDLCLGAEDHVLKGRCLGATPRQVAELGSIYIRTLQDRGVLATAKHFPGIGTVKVDPHLERPVVDISIDEIEWGLIPFKEAIGAGVAAIMTSHVVFSSIEPDLPATFSKKVASHMLREELDFTGVLLSDDLEMKGITRHIDIGKAAVDAFLAGHDLLLVCNSYENVVYCLDSLKAAFEHGAIHVERVETSLKRIETVKAGQKT